MRLPLAILALAGLLLAQKPQLTLQMGHSKEVETGLFSHNGKWALSTAGDGTAILWDAATGIEIRRFHDTRSILWTACFTVDDRAIFAAGPSEAWLWDIATGREIGRFDGLTNTGTVRATARLLLTADEDSTRLWDPATLKEIRRFAGPSPAALSPDGQTLATAIPGDKDSKDGGIILWDIGGVERARLKGHTDRLSSLAFSPDGRTLLSASHDATIRSWNRISRQEQWRYTAQKNTLIYGVMASPDGRYAVAGMPAGACLFGATDGRLQRCFQGNSNFTNGVDFSADGRQLLTTVSDAANKENRLVLWDVASGREVRRFEGYGSGLQSAVFSADRRYIGTAGGNGEAHIWDLWRGVESRRIAPTGHTSDIWAAVYSPDGRYLASASRDHTARLWDVASGAEVRKFEHGDDVNMVAFSPDGRRLATASSDHTARLWDTASGNELWRTSTHSDRVWGVAFSPDGHTVATASEDSTVRLWDSASGKEQRRIGTQTPVGRVTFSPDGRVLAAGVGGALMQWDARTGAVVRQLATGGARVASIAYSTDGKLLAAGSMRENGGAGEVILWNAATGVEIRRIAAPGKKALFPSVAFSPDGRSLAAAVVENGGSPNVAMLWDIASGHELRQFRGHADSVFSAAFSPDGKTLATASADRTLRLWDTGGGNEIRRFESHGASSEVTALAFSPDARWVATGDFDAVARLWDRESGEEVRTMPLAAPDGSSLGSSFSIASLEFSPDGKYVMGGIGDLSGSYNAAAVWEVASGKVKDAVGGKQAEHKGISLGVRDAAYSADGSQIVTASEDHTVRLWDHASGKELHTFTDSSGEVKAVAFAKDGRIVTAGSEARILDGKTFREIRKLNNTIGELATAAFSPDGSLVATAGWGGVITLFNTADGREVRRLGGHLDIIWSVRFSPDGKLLLSASLDGTARLWKVADGRELCQLISFPDGVWVVVDPEGRFDTNNPDGIRGLKWIAPDDPLHPLPVEIFLREYYEPQLLARIVAGKTFKPVRSLTSINRVQPVVKIVGIEPGAPGTVGITVDLSGAPASDLRLFRDGQMVGYQAGRNAAGRHVFAGIQIPVGQTGKAIAFTAYAFNDDKIKSETAAQPYTYATAVPAKARRAYIVSLGVNYNEMPALRLTTGVNDARHTGDSLAAALRKTGEYADVVTVPLLSDDRVRTATRDNFHAVLDLLAGHTVSPAAMAAIPNAAQLHKAASDDLVILSASSHGYRSPEQVFYLVPYVTVKDEARMDDVWPQSISSDDLELWLRDVDAGEMVLLIDACYAGAAIQTRGFVPGPMGSRGLGQLAYDKGMRVLTATQASNVAIESQTLGYSLLTYALFVEGLDKQLAAGRAGRITVSGLLEYAEARVPKLFHEALEGKVTTRSPIANADPSVQQPMLFDFVRNGRETTLASGIAVPAQQQNRDSFSDAVMELDSRLAGTMRAFGKAVEPFSAGQPGDRDALHKTFDAAMAALTTALSQSANMKPPPTPDCRELLAAFREFLNVVQTQIAPELKTVVSKIDDAGGKLDLLGKLQVMGSLNKCEKADVSSRERFVTAAKEFDRIDKSIR